MPTTFYTQEEYDLLQRRLSDANRRIGTLEQLRPVWATGFTDDSITAQSLGNALSQLWKELGATNQTQAMQRMRELKGAEILYNEVHKLGR